MPGTADCGTPGNPCPTHADPNGSGYRVAHDEQGVGWGKYHGPRRLPLSFLDGIEMTDAERLTELVGLYGRRLREEGLEVER